MQLKSALRKSAELGIGLTAITTLILSGCGGGGGSTNTTNNTPTAAVRITTVTPGKGKMVGAVVSIKAADGTTVLGSADTNSAGKASVSIAASTTGPFIVSVSCPATCTYYDEKTGTMVSGSASAPAMLAVVPSAAYLDIGVTAATNAAAQYAIATGALTTTSVVAANNIVISNLGLSGVADLLTPPTIISDSTTLASAKAGTTAADKLANYSASIALAASGVSAIQAIADYGNAWKQAALTPATGVVLPATIDPALLVTNAPTFPVATIPNVASQVVAATTAAASAVANVSSWVAEVSVAGNSNNWWRNTYYANAAAAASGVLTTDVHANSENIAVAGNTLTFSGTKLKLSGGAWVTQTDPNIYYSLNSTGWVLGSNGGTVVNNLDGTLTVTPAGQETTVEAITRTDLSGTPIYCYNNAGSPCAAGTQLYPAGSFYTSSLETVPVDHYELNNGSTQFPTKVTNMSGVALTALPAAGSSFCVQQGSGAAIFRPINPPQVGDNYNEFGAWSCSAADITAAGAVIGAAVAGQTVTLSFQATGNAVVASVGLVTVNPIASPTIAWMNNAIVGVRAGQTYTGTRYPAGTFGNLQIKNKTATNAELVANGYPVLH